MRNVTYYITSIIYRRVMTILGETHKLIANIFIIITSRTGARRGFANYRLIYTSRNGTYRRQDRAKFATKDRSR